MNRETFDKLVENYDSKDEILVSKMALLIEKYPYFQLPRFFYTKSLKDQNKNDNFTLNDISIKDNEDPMKYFDNNQHKNFLNSIGIVKMCCVRHFISHVDLIDII